MYLKKHKNLSHIPEDAFSVIFQFLSEKELKIMGNLYVSRNYDFSVCACNYDELKKEISDTIRNIKTNVVFFISSGPDGNYSDCVFIRPHKNTVFYSNYAMTKKAEQILRSFDKKKDNIKIILTSILKSEENIEGSNIAYKALLNEQGKKNGQIHRIRHEKLMNNNLSNMRGKICPSIVCTKLSKSAHVEFERITRIMVLFFGGCINRIRKSYKDCKRYDVCDWPRLFQNLEIATKESYQRKFKGIQSIFNRRNNYYSPSIYIFDGYYLNNNIFSLMRAEKNFSFLPSIAVAYEKSKFFRNKDTFFCYGRNADGELGLGHSNGIPKPIKHKRLTELKIFEIILGKNFCFGRTKNYIWYCWGKNNDGELGLNHNNPVPKPIKHKRLTELKIFEIIPGENFCFARTKNYIWYCWGRNADGELGLDYRNHVPGPIKHKCLTDLKISEIILDRNFRFGRTKNYIWYCWGSAMRKTFNLNNNARVPEPVKHNYLTELKISKIIPVVGSYFAQKKDGRWYCWGYNGYGELGLGHQDIVSKPVEHKYLTELGIIEIIPGYNSCFGRTKKGVCYCWGRDQGGAIGQLSCIISLPSPVCWLLDHKGLTEKFNALKRRIKNLKGFVSDEEKKMLHDMWIEIVFEFISSHSLEKTITFNRFSVRVSRLENIRKNPEK